MFDPERLVQQFIGNAMGGVFGGGKKKKKSSFLQGGNLAGKATVGLGLLGVAMAAYEHYRQRGQNPAGTSSATPPVAPGVAYPPPPPAASPSQNMSPPPPPGAAAARDADPADTRRQEAILLLRAMIAAAAADGSVDASERQRLVEQARAAGADNDDLAFLERELALPQSPEQIAAATPPAQADEVYAASLLAIAVDSPAEEAHLDRLANALKLSPERRQSLQAQFAPAA